MQKKRLVLKLTGIVMLLLGLLLGVGIVLFIIFSAGFGLISILESKWPLPAAAILVIGGWILGKMSERTS